MRVIRSCGPLLRSRPSGGLILASVAVIAIALVVPHTSLGTRFGFVLLQPSVLRVLVLILVAYGTTAALVKTRFCRLESQRHRRGGSAAVPFPAGMPPDC